MKTNEKGCVGETRFIYEFTERGWKVSLPLGHDAAYDMIVDTPSGLKRVQVKATSSKEDCVVVRLERTYTSGDRIVSRTYEATDFDWLAIYDVRLKNCYLLSVGDVVNKTGINLRLTKPKNNQVKNVLLAENYLIDKMRV